MKTTQTQKPLIILSLTLLLSTLHVQAQDHLWKFDEGSGLTSSDSIRSTNSVNAVLKSPTWSNHGSGSSVHIDGTDGSYVSFGKNVGQFGTQDFSVALWIQTNDKSINLADLIGNRAEYGSGNYLAVRIRQDGHVTAEVDQNGNNYIGVTSNVNNLNNGQWHYLVITRASKTLSLYIDGALSSSASASGVANINNGREFKIGRSLVSSSTTRFSLSASFDDVAIYSAALSASQISSQYQTPPSTKPDSCWLNSYGRGVGKPISTCSSGQQQNGALCYPTCSAGYSGVGPVCWQNCPSGFSDTGADCLKPSSYGRGAGYVLWKKGDCENDNPQGCEKYGALYYPKCKENFHNAGCCVCSPNCPSDMTDIGVSCQKKSYGRGAGNPLVCASGLQEDAALCYTACKSGYSGKGPVCWGSCPNGLYQCGALCLQSEAECTSEMLNIGLKALQGVLEVASEIENPVGAVISAAETVIDIAGDLNYPIC